MGKLVKRVTSVRCTPNRFSEDIRLVDAGIDRMKRVDCVIIRGVSEAGTTSGVNFYNVIKDDEHDINVKIERKELVARGVVVEREPLAHVKIDFWVEAKN